MVIRRRATSVRRFIPKELSDAFRSDEPKVRPAPVLVENVELVWSSPTSLEVFYRASETFVSAKAGARGAGSDEIWTRHEVDAVRISYSH